MIGLMGISACAAPARNCFSDQVSHTGSRSGDIEKNVRIEENRPSPRVSFIKSLVFAPAPSPRHGRVATCVVKLAFLNKKSDNLIN
jgi:hypothetical protein